MYQVQQSDDAPGITATAGCSGGSVNGLNPPAIWQASDGATPGSADKTTTIPPISIPGEVHVNIEALIADGLVWSAGDHVVRLNVKSDASLGGEFNAIYACRFNSSNVNQETLGSITGLTTAVTPGVITFTIACGGATPAAGDKVVYVVQMANTSPMSTVTVPFTPDQLITLPFSSGPPVGGLALMGVGR